MVDEAIEEIITEEDLIVEPILSEEELAAIEAKELEVAAEVERQRRQSFEADLEARYKALFDRNAAFHQQGISNPDLYFNQQILFNRQESKASENMLKIENQDGLNKLAYESSKDLEDRKKAYKAIDQELLEALAENAGGKPSKLNTYLVKREAIRVKFPNVGK